MRLVHIKAEFAVIIRSMSTPFSTVSKAPFYHLNNNSMTVDINPFVLVFVSLRLRVISRHIHTIAAPLITGIVALLTSPYLDLHKPCLPGFWMTPLSSSSIPCSLWFISHEVGWPPHNYNAYILSLLGYKSPHRHLKPRCYPAMRGHR